MKITLGDKELLADIDKAIDREQRRYERLLSIAKKDPDGTC